MKTWSFFCQSCVGLLYGDTIWWFDKDIITEHQQKVSSLTHLGTYSFLRPHILRMSPFSRNYHHESTLRLRPSYLWPRCTSRTQQGRWSPCPGRRSPRRRCSPRHTRNISTAASLSPPEPPPPLGQHCNIKGSQLISWPWTCLGGWLTPITIHTHTHIKLTVASS